MTDETTKIIMTDYDDERYLINAPILGEPIHTYRLERVGLDNNGLEKELPGPKRVSYFVSQCGSVKDLVLEGRARILVRLDLNSFDEYHLIHRRELSSRRCLSGIADTYEEAEERATRIVKEKAEKFAHEAKASRVPIQYGKFAVAGGWANDQEVIVGEAGRVISSPSLYRDRLSAVEGKGDDKNS